MKCDTERLSEYVLGMADETQAKAMEAHLESCAECTRRLARLRNAAGLLEEVPRSGDDPVDMDRLWASIASRNRPATRVTGRTGHQWRWAAALAMAACFVLVCIRYGVAVRVGEFELAFGGRERSTAEVRKTDAIDETVVRGIASDEVARSVAPGLNELAAYVGEIETRYDRELMTLRSQFARWRDQDRRETERNIRLIAGEIDSIFNPQ